MMPYVGKTGDILRHVEFHQEITVQSACAFYMFPYNYNNIGHKFARRVRGLPVLQLLILLEWLHFLIINAVKLLSCIPLKLLAIIYYCESVYFRPTFTSYTTLFVLDLSCFRGFRNIVSFVYIGTYVKVSNINDASKTFL